MIEAPYVGTMIEQCEFDTIYHEHLCYFSLTALDQLFRRQGLVIRRVERIPIHGGSLRIFAFPEAAAVAPDDSVRELLAAEAQAGINTFAYYRDFAARVKTLGQTLTALLHGLKREGKTIAAYGAAAKGSTLLNTFRLGTETIDFVVDRSTHKQGRYLPGVHLPVEAPDVLLTRSPDYVLLLTWNFADEIFEQQAEYRRRGGKFIVPVPTPTIV